MTPAQTHAIAEADAHLNNAGLPTYSELVSLLVAKSRANNLIKQIRADGGIRNSKTENLRHLELIKRTAHGALDRYVEKLGTLGAKS